jgi:hypothetical protein
MSKVATAHAALATYAQEVLAPNVLINDVAMANNAAIPALNSRKSQSLPSVGTRSESSTARSWPALASSVGGFPFAHDALPAARPVWEPVPNASLIERPRALDHRSFDVHLDLEVLEAALSGALRAWAGGRMNAIRSSFPCYGSSLKVRV